MAAKNGMREEYMERQWDIDNTRERERLRKLVGEIIDEELNLVIYKQGYPGPSTARCTSMK
jgi:hypothetical protein